MRPSPPQPILRRHRLADAATRAVLAGLQWLPYPRRVAAMGWFARRILGPLAFNRRILANLTLVMPDLDDTAKTQICRETAETFGRATIEIYSPREFGTIVRQTPLGGPGLDALRAARDAGRPVIIAPIHLANVAVGTAALAANGFPAGQAYRPLSNPLTNARYVSIIQQYGARVFPTVTQGMAEMITFLRGGGMLALLHDTHAPAGELLDFMGKPARTALSAAKLALKYNALLVPLYVRRQDDGLSFAIDVAPPIPHTDVRTMTQALNDSAAARVRQTPGQWFWLHRRWKRT